jgi:hypothetical protein
LKEIFGRILAVQFMFFEQFQQGAVPFERDQVEKHPSFKGLGILHACTVGVENIFEGINHAFDLSACFVSEINIFGFQGCIFDYGNSTEKMFFGIKFINCIILNLTFYAVQTVLFFPITQFSFSKSTTKTILLFSAIVVKKIQYVSFFDKNITAAIGFCDFRNTDNTFFALIGLKSDFF